MSTNLTVSDRAFSRTSPRKELNREMIDLDYPAKELVGDGFLNGMNASFNNVDSDPNDSVEGTDGCCASCPCFSKVTKCLGGAVEKVFPSGGVLSTALIMASTSIGAGILGLPGAMNSCGLVVAMIYLVIFAVFTAFSIRMLAIGAERSGSRTFEGIIQALFPQWHHAFAYWAAFIRWFNCFGSCVGYIISVQDLFKPIFTEASRRDPDNKSLAYIASTNGRRLVAFLIWLVFLLPLVIPKHVNSLRYASFIAIAFMLYFCIIIVVHSCMNGLPEHRGNIKFTGHLGQNDGDNIYLFRTGNPALGQLGTFMFAFVMQITATECYYDLRPEIRSPNTMTKAGALAMVITFIIYSFVSIFGYFDFGAEALGTNSILLMYNPLDNPDQMVAYVGVLLKLCVAFAIQLLAARNSIYYAIGWTKKYRHTAVPADAVSGGNEATLDCGEHPAAAAGSVDGDDDPSGTFVDNIPMWRHLIVVIGFASFCLILGLFIPKISIVFGFTGAICGGFLGFIFPALLVIYSGGFTPQKQGWLMYVMSYVMLVVGVVGVVFGTGATIYSLAGGK